MRLDLTVWGKCLEPVGPEEELSDSDYDEKAEYEEEEEEEEEEVSDADNEEDEDYGEMEEDGQKKKAEECLPICSGHGGRHPAEHEWC